MPLQPTKRIIWTGLLLLLASTAAAQAPADTLRYSVQEAEKIFLQNNLLLLAEKLNIDQAEAHILQAKAWPNPSFTVDEVNLWATARQTGGAEVSPPFRNGWGKNQQFAMQLEQLVQTARKRQKSIQLEASSKTLAERSFTDLLYALRAEFRQTAAGLIYHQHLLQDLTLQQTLVTRLLDAQTAQYTLGNVPEAELVRLRALQFSLRAEINDMKATAGEEQQQLKTLMALEPERYLVLEDSEPHFSALRQLSLHALLRSAEEHNPALQTALAAIKMNEAAYALERSKRVPDLRFNMSYDRNGSTMLDFVGFGVAVDLPFFDRNKGNIRAASLQVRQSELAYRHKSSETGNSVAKTFADLQNALQAATAIDTAYLHRLDVLMQGLTLNFMQRNISLLEFLDFFTSFRENKQLYYQAVRSVATLKESLNYLTGSDL
ncbi:TolC family protein [Chitinophaga alhagiae]|uniref:TolC family protein n=1 Tax=Chitinophaga alhagiae TaxID=2203219 RepID=UPI0018E5508D|nr:TolC family protein [Chitinophaga alhagiae]